MRAMHECPRVSELDVAATSSCYSAGRAHGDVWSPLTGLAWWIMGRSGWSGVKWAVEMGPWDHGAAENGDVSLSLLFFLHDPEPMTPGGERIRSSFDFTPALCKLVLSEMGYHRLALGSAAQSCLFFTNR
jgi:hypothetical protein